MAERARLTPPQTKQVEWKWHELNISTIRSTLLSSGDRRMEAETYLADGYGIRLSLEAHDGGWKRLSDLASIWQPSRLKGIQVNEKNGVAFLAATQIYDDRPRPRKWLSAEHTPEYNLRQWKPGLILVTRSGSVGRATLGSTVLQNTILSDDLLRVEAIDSDWTGWIYGYLRAPSIRKVMTSAQYGHMIQHLERSHLGNVPIITVDRATRLQFARMMSDLMDLRDSATHKTEAAEKLISDVFGNEISCDAVVGYTVSSRSFSTGRRRMEGFHHNRGAQFARATLASAAFRMEPLSDLVDDIFVPGRFKHVYGPEGVPYLDSAQIVESSPDITKRVLSLNSVTRAKYLVNRNWLLIPTSGQLHGIVGSAVIANAWHENKVLSNHIMRIVPRSSSISVGYLQGVLSHPILGRPRVLKEAYGSSVPELDAKDIARIEIPRIDPNQELAIATLMEDAAALRAQADILEERISSSAENIVHGYLSGSAI